VDSRPAVAIVGMACRFPGARTPVEYWSNLREGRETVRVFTEAELTSAGVDPVLVRAPGYVPVNGVADEVEWFDAGFFAMTPREAEITDPQHRLFLEVCWEALESDGYGGDRPGRVGVFAGAGMSTYLLHHLLARPDVVEQVGDLELLMANDKDYVATRVAYKLNLRGPAVSANAACSTGLVNVHLGCQSLLAHECDMALAGGVSVKLPQDRGYLFQPGGILSPDGHCRAFDARAAGTVSGNGAGVVLLKRLEDAIADRDHVHAVILGSAMTNDGADKAGFTAPSVSGQADAIAQALAIADVPVESIGYVEAHGTGTPVGDPIEIAALTRVFRAHTPRAGFCAIGSVKTNVGHLDEAAGVAGLMKAALALEHGEIPPSLHFEAPNPECALPASPFEVAVRLRAWPPAEHPRRAAVSSFGLGGTNVHAVLEAPPTLGSGPGRPWQLVALSAHTGAALEAATARLCEALAGTPAPALPDVAYTLLAGRRRFASRRAVVGRDAAEVVERLRRGDPDQVVTVEESREDRPVVFLFSGHGAQYAGMGRGLYETEPVFREALDRCAGILQGTLEGDVRTVMFGTGAVAEAALRRMSWAQPALFALEYALARLWIAWGVRPIAMIGHSAGEYVAACLAGVFELEDALGLIAERGRLLERTGPGAMVAVALPEAEVRARLTGTLSLAAVTVPDMCVVSGRPAEVGAFRDRLVGAGVDCRPVDVAVAAHSAAMDPVLGPYGARVARVVCRAPREPFVSNVTGTWITAGEATDPGYWVRHLRSTVRFADGVGVLLAEHPDACFLEVGPGRSLAGPVRRHPARTAAQPVVTTLRHADEAEAADPPHVLSALGRLWAAGVRIDPDGLYAGEARRRVCLPTYPFERKRYWVAPGRAAPGSPVRSRSRRARVEDWLYLPSWRRSLPPPPPAARRRYLVVEDAGGLGAGLAERLGQAGHEVARVAPGASPGADALVAADEVVDLRACDPVADGAGARRLVLDLVAVGRVLGARPGSTGLTVVSTGVQDVSPRDPLEPLKAVVLGPVQTIEQEHPHVRCRAVDVALPPPGDPGIAALLDHLVAETASADPDRLVAWRGGQRWCREYVPLRPPPVPPPAPLRPGGVYVLTGGTGEVGRVVAEYLARAVQARLVLVSRSGVLPPDTRGRLERAGAEVLVRAADAADEPAMRAILDEATRRFGRIDGVVHAAGVTGSETVFRAVAETTAEQVDALFRPKVEGAAVLARLLRDRPLDFCLLVSSNASTLGGLGLSAYAAASHVLDAIAAACRRQGHPWISSNWDGWPSEAARDPAVETGLQAYAMTREEAESALVRVLACDVERVVVSAGDLQARLDSWLGDAGPAGDGAGPVPGAPDEAHARPGHIGAFVEPGTAVERAVAAAFEELTGVRPVGLHDSFFELGGDSLLGSRVVARLARRFGAQLSVRVLFAEPTVARLAARVEAAVALVGAPPEPAGPDEEEGTL
jgi:acyl transferase domain-containing protein